MMKNSFEDWRLQTKYWVTLKTDYPNCPWAYMTQTGNGQAGGTYTESCNPPVSYLFYLRFFLYMSNSASNLVLHIVQCTRRHTAPTQTAREHLTLWPPIQKPTALFVAKLWENIFLQAHLLFKEKLIFWTRLNAAPPYYSPNHLSHSNSFPFFRESPLLCFPRLPWSSYFPRCFNLGFPKSLRLSTAVHCMYMTPQVSCLCSMTAILAVLRNYIGVLYRSYMFIPNQSSSVKPVTCHFNSTACIL